MKQKLKMESLRYKTLIIIILSTIYFIPLHAEQITLTAFNYPPFMDESLPKKGLFCELVYEAYKSVGYDVSFKFYPLKRSTQGVIVGEELAQLGTRWNFPKKDREDNVQFVPLFYYRVVGFYLKDRVKNASFKTLKELQGYRLGVLAGSSDSLILKKYPELNLNIEEVNKIELLFKKTYQNRNDILFTVELSGLSFIANHYPSDKDRWVMTEDAIQGIVADVIFSNKYPFVQRYKDAFLEGVKRIRANGTYFQIFEKYYGIQKVPDGIDDIYRETYEIPKE